MQQNAALEDLFVDTLKDIYSAEKQILKALPKLARAADDDRLRRAFESHREETEAQVDRLDQVFEMIGRRPGGVVCEAMEGILEEGTEAIEEFRGSTVLDAGLISSAQAVEQYEIGRYTSLARWARELDLEEAATLLEETLREEESADKKLGALADRQLKSQSGSSSVKKNATTAPSASSKMVGKTPAKPATAKTADKPSTPETPAV